MPDNFSYDEEDEKITLGGGIDFKKILIWLVPLVVVVVAGYFFFLRGGGDEEPPGEIPVATETVAADTVRHAPITPESVQVAAPPEETAAVMERTSDDTSPEAEEPAVEQTTTPATGTAKPKPETPDLAGYKFHVIVGAFGVESNAVALSNKLKAQGYQSKTLPIRDGTMTAVTCGSFRTKDEAVVELRRIQREYDKNAWILEEK